MKKVQRSKSPTPRQMLNMASNLEEKFDKPSQIKVSASSWYPTPRYTVYIEGEVLDWDKFETWFACQEKYFLLMKEGLP